MDRPTHPGVSAGNPQLEVAAPSYTSQQDFALFTLPNPSPTGGSGAYTYAWTWLSRPANAAATFSNAAIAQPTVTPDEPGMWVAQCVVSDGVVSIEYVYSRYVGVQGVWTTLNLLAPEASGNPVGLTGAVTDQGGGIYRVPVNNGITAKLSAQVSPGYGGSWWQFPSLDWPIPGRVVAEFIIEVWTAGLTKAAISNVAVGMGLSDAAWNPAAPGDFFASSWRDALAAHTSHANVHTSKLAGVGDDESYVATANYYVTVIQPRISRTGVLLDRMVYLEQQNYTPISDSEPPAAGQLFNAGDAPKLMVWVHTYTGTSNVNVNDYLDVRCRVFVSAAYV